MTEAGPGEVAADGRREPLGIVEIALVFGLPLFVAVAAVGTWWSVGRVEDRVASAMRADLAAVGVDADELTIYVSYRDGAITGTLPSGVEPEVVEVAIDHELLRRLDLGGLVAGPPVPDRAAGIDGRELATGPVQIEVVYDGLDLRVTGTVLNEGQHNVVLETIDLMNGRAEVEEQLTISRLAPAVDGADARIADLVTAIGAMELADEWSIRLTDRGLTIEAVVADPEAAAAVAALDRLLTATPTTIELTAPDSAEAAR